MVFKFPEDETKDFVHPSAVRSRSKLSAVGWSAISFLHSSRWRPQRDAARVAPVSASPLSPPYGGWNTETVPLFTALLSPRVLLPPSRH